MTIYGTITELQLHCIIIKATMSKWQWLQKCMQILQYYPQLLIKLKKILINGEKNIKIKLIIILEITIKISILTLKKDQIYFKIQYWNSKKVYSFVQISLMSLVKKWEKWLTSLTNSMNLRISSKSYFTLIYKKENKAQNKLWQIMTKKIKYRNNKKYIWNKSIKYFRI